MEVLVPPEVSRPLTMTIICSWVLMQELSFLALHTTALEWQLLDICWSPLKREVLIDPDHLTPSAATIFPQK